MLVFRGVSVFHSCRGCALTVCFRGRHFYQVALSFGQIFVGCFHILDGTFFPPKLGKDVPYVWCCKSFCELGGCGRWKCDQWLCSWGDFTPSYGLNLPISGPFDPGFLEKNESSQAVFFFCQKKNTGKPKKIRPTTIALAPASLSKKKRTHFGRLPRFYRGFSLGLFPWGRFEVADGGIFGEIGAPKQFLSYEKTWRRWFSATFIATIHCRLGNSKKKWCPEIQG